MISFKLYLKPRRCAKPVLPLPNYFRSIAVMREQPSLTLADILEDNAVRFGSTPAYIFGGREISHRDLLHRAKHLASALATAGIDRQDRVAILSMNCIEFGEVLAMGQWSGVIVATVNFRLAPPEMAYIINNSSPRVLFFEAQYLPLIEKLRSDLPGVETYVCIGGQAVWAVDYESFVAKGQQEPPYQARPEDIACLIYTSGTTGKPKGCILGQAEMRVGAERMSIEMRAGSADRILLVMPLFHIGAMAMGQGMHFRGGTVVLHRQFEPASLLAAVRDDGITILHLAPTLVQMVLDHADTARTEFSGVHTIVYSAAAMPLPVLKRGIALIGNVFTNLYGQTEVFSSGLPRELHRPDGSDAEKRWLTSVGHPFPNTQIRIVDEEHRECAVGSAGEIIVKSAAMARGYWNNHAASIEGFRDGWCYTGDVGLIDEDGILYLVDRKKDVIISGGENIYSREVEDAVLTHPAIAECAVIGVQDEKWGESVCAVVVLRAGSQLSEADLIEYTRSLIASYKKPRCVVFAAELPKLPTGKINKVELRKRHS
jgi:acyl-CoA synthetase (AMP-forming)/AMP-acid ligase II